MERVKRFALVTVMAALIWAFAEGESLQTQRAVAEIDFPALTGETWATRVAEGQNWRGRVELELEGPTAGLDELESVLRRPLAFAPGIEGLPTETGEYTLDLRQALRAHPEFRSRGVAVVGAEPNTVRVRVQELATVAVPIRVEAPAAELEGAAELVGVDEAVVRLPAEAAAELQGGEAWMVARVNPEDLAALQERVRSTVRVRLTPGPRLEAAPLFGIEPQQVEVRLTVRSKTETTVLTTVPVDLRLPSTELGRWEVVIPQEDQTLRDVTVTGPSDVIDRIEAGTLPVRAYVRLSYDDLERGVTVKRAEFSGYPSPLGFSAEDLNVKLEIRPRGEGSEGEAGGAAPG